MRRPRLTGVITEGQSAAETNDGDAAAISLHAAKGVTMYLFSIWLPSINIGYQDKSNSFKIALTLWGGRKRQANVGFQQMSA
jgi:hypothetical protein